MQTGSPLVASRFTARTRAGSDSALKRSAVASASAAVSVGVASGAQQVTANVSITVNISTDVDMSRCRQELEHAHAAVDHLDDRGRALLQRAAEQLLDHVAVRARDTAVELREERERRPRSALGE